MTAKITKNFLPIGDKFNISIKIEGNEEERSEILNNMRKNLASMMDVSELASLETYTVENSNVISFATKKNSLTANLHGAPPGYLYGLSIDPLQDSETRFKASLLYDDYLSGAHYYLNDILPKL